MGFSFVGDLANDLGYEGPTWGDRARQAGHAAEWGAEKGGHKGAEKLTDELDELGGGLPGGAISKKLLSDGGGGIGAVAAQARGAMASSAAKGETEMVLEAGEAAAHTTGTKSHLGDINKAATANVTDYASDLVSRPILGDAWDLGKDAVGWGTDLISEGLTDMVPGAKYVLEPHKLDAVTHAAESSMATGGANSAMDTVLAASRGAFAQLGRKNPNQDKLEAGAAVREHGDEGIVGDALRSLYAHMSD